MGMASKRGNVSYGHEYSQEDSKVSTEILFGSSVILPDFRLSYLHRVGRSWRDPPQKLAARDDLHGVCGREGVRRWLFAGSLLIGTNWRGQYRRSSLLQNIWQYSGVQVSVLR
jgi:hypothetical protein